MTPNACKEQSLTYLCDFLDTNDNLICVKAYPGATDRNQG